MWHCDEVTLYVCDIHVCAGTHVRRAKVGSGWVLQSHLYSIHLRQGLSLNLKLLQPASLYLPILQHHSRIIALFNFYLVLGIWTSVSNFVYQAFYPLSYLYSLFLFFNSINPMRFIQPCVQLWTEHKQKLHSMAVNLLYFWVVTTISNPRTLISTSFYICIFV